METWPWHGRASRPRRTLGFLPEAEVRIARGETIGEIRRSSTSRSGPTTRTIAVEAPPHWPQFLRDAVEVVAGRRVICCHGRPFQGRSTEGGCRHSRYQDACRKNTDPTLQATHTIDLKFSFADGAPITGVKEVEPKMRNLGPTPSEALTGARVKISDVYFLIALANSNQDDP
jgi:hypothetical protein